MPITVETFDTESDTTTPASKQVGFALVVSKRKTNTSPVLRSLHHITRYEIVGSVEAAIGRMREDTFDLLIVDATGCTPSVLVDWLPLFALPAPVFICFAPDDRFVIRALHMGAEDCVTAHTAAPVVAARALSLIQRGQHERAYRQKLQEMALTSQMQERFYRIVSHDIKGPLTNLRMAHYLLRDIFNDHEQAHTLLANADMSLNEIQEMVRVFLDVGASQPGKIDLNIECLQVRPIIDGVVRQYVLLAARKQIRIEVEIEDDLMMADSRMLHHIFGNLLNNAIKYSPHHSTIMVTLRPHGNWKRIEVRDCGPGIPVYERPALFQPFSRLSSRPTGDETSTGLGLWIVRHLTEIQHGQVGADFPPEGGSHFYVHLPTCTIPD